jgi:hypothetical protein
VRPMAADHASIESRLRDLYAQAAAAREQSRLLAEQLRAAQVKARENWQHIREAWDRAELILADRQAAGNDPDRLRYSAYARMQARLASMPVIEQAKGILIAQYGWTDDQAFDALRRASQRKNVKVRDLAATIVARAARSAPGQRQARPAPKAVRADVEVSLSRARAGSRDRYRASA